MPEFEATPPPRPKPKRAPKRRPRTKPQPAPYPCTICNAPVPARDALLQFATHPGKRGTVYPLCLTHERSIAYHVQRIRESRAAMDAAIADGVDDDG